MMDRALILERKQSLVWGWWNVANRPFSLQTFWLVLAGKAGVTNSIADGSVPFQCPRNPYQWAGMCNNRVVERALILKQIPVSLTLLITPVLLSLWCIKVGKGSCQIAAIQLLLFCLWFHKLFFFHKKKKQKNFYTWMFFCLCSQLHSSILPF